MNRMKEKSVIHHPKHDRPRKQLTLRLPFDVHLELKIRAAKEGRSMGELIERLIRQWLEGRVGGKRT